MIIDENLYVAHESKHGLQGMIGSLDCTHFGMEEIPNCVEQWKGRFTRCDIGEPTFIPKVIASQDLWVF